MASKTCICAICDRRQITKPSVVWCLKCDEGLCLECKEHHGLSKASLNHNTLSISEYEKLRPNMKESSQFCNKHNEEFTTYCTKHDLKTFEQRMTDFIDNIQRIRKVTKENISQLKCEREQIEKEIWKTRMKINAELDKLQQTMIKELHKAEEEQREQKKQLLTLLAITEQEISEYQATLAHLKQHASNLETFTATKQIECYVVSKDEFVTSLLKSGKLNHVSLSCTINETLLNGFNETKKFGEVIVEMKPPESAIVHINAKQAQMVVAFNPLKPFDNRTFQLQKTIDTKSLDTTGCALLPDGRMVFSCYEKQHVRGFKSDGSKDFDFKIPDGAFDIAYIKADNTIAVTSGGRRNRCISIIQVESGTLIRSIPVNSENRGITASSKSLIFCGRDSLRMIKLTDENGVKIVTSSMSVLAYVATFCDKLYYTNRDKHTVTCCDLSGKTHWEFRDERVLNCPLGITVDRYGNAYVVGHVSCNVLVISSDGQRHRELLSSKDGLNFPKALHFDDSTCQLLVANQYNSALLFKLR